MRALLLLLACRALAAPAAPAAGAPPPPDSARAVEESMARLRRHMEEMAPLLDQLKAITSKYGESAGLDELKAKSERLRKELEARQKALDDMGEEFNTLKREDQLQRTSMAVRRILREKNLHPFEKDLQAAFDQNEFKKKVDNFKMEVTAALRAEEEARRAAERALETRRYLLWSVWAGSVLLLGLGALLFRLRSRAALETVEASAALAAPGVRTPAPFSAGAIAGLAGPAGPAGDALPVGAVLGGSFKVVRELGKGSMGPVYEALDLARQKPVVIKRIREELHRSEKDLERFLAEARQVAGLRHRNLAEIYSVFIDHERICLAMEFVWGRSLSRFLDSGSRISLRSIKTVFSQVAAVLDHAHAQRVVHGDLKPSNVMVTPEGLAKVMDFSLALAAKRTIAKLSWAEAGGSPAYMAPEQELGEAGRESDIYSLGIIFYEMVTGRLPFEGPNFLAQKREMRYRPPSKAIPGLAKEVDLVVHTALQPDGKYRFATARDMFAMINALPDEPPYASAPQTPPPQARPGEPQKS